jgi:hypothetical protein
MIIICSSGNTIRENNCDVELGCSSNPAASLSSVENDGVSLVGLSVMIFTFFVNAEILADEHLYKTFFQNL